MNRRLERQLVEAIKQQAATRKAVRLPGAGKLFWTMFAELNRSRTAGPMGPNPIQFNEIESWARLNRWPLEPRHVALIKSMDDAWLEVTYSKGGHSAPTPATPEALDAMFNAAGWG